MTKNPDAASVAVIDKGRVLLIQRAQAPYSGMWTLPGGRLEPEEDAEACAIREVREELGLSVHALRPLTRLALGGSADFLLQVFATEAFEGAIVPSAEIMAYRWVWREMAGGLRTTPHLPDVLELAFRLFDKS